jgi:hypothetical protein
MQVVAETELLTARLERQRRRDGQQDEQAVIASAVSHRKRGEMTINEPLAKLKG